jgi:hypothetical protein
MASSVISASVMFWRISTSVTSLSFNFSRSSFSSATIRAYSSSLDSSSSTPIYWSHACIKKRRTDKDRIVIIGLGN